MTVTLQFWRQRVAAALLMPVALVACEQKKAVKRKPLATEESRAYTIRQLGAVCMSAGKKVRGAPYKKKTDPKAFSPIAVFKRALDDDKPRYVHIKRRGYAAWEAAAPESVELVACVDTKKNDRAPGSCSFPGAKIRHFDMTYTVRVIEPVTGKEVLKEEFKVGGDAARCPSSSPPGTFYRSSSYSPKVASLIARFQPKGAVPYDAAQAPPKAGQLDMVCDGVPFPESSPYVKGSKGKLRVAYRTSDKYSYFSETPFDRRSAPSTGVQDFQLVACVTGKPKQKKDRCEFPPKTLQLYEGEIEVVLRESATANVVETKTFKASPGVCPKAHRFWTKEEAYFGELEPAFFAYLDSLDGGSTESKTRP